MRELLNKFHMLVIAEPFERWLAGGTPLYSGCLRLEEQMAAKTRINHD
jgi:hypothetical protein